MLVNKPISVGDIVAFKLANGDEIIASIESESDLSYMLSKPATLMPTDKGIGMMQSMLSGDMARTVELFKSQIMMRSQVADHMRKHYIETTTDIKTVSAPGIIV